MGSEQKIKNGLKAAEDDLKPWNNFVTPMLTDLYQITMAYAYWHSKKHEEHSVFDLFFRKNPFDGEYTIFAGLEECLRFIHSFKFTQDDVNALEGRFPDWDKGFWPYLQGLDCSQVQVYAIPEGTVVFPRIPMMRIEGPLAICQLLETTLLVLVNYASLVTTNGARHRRAAGANKTLFEFGLRRAQGPDGAMSASRYTYVGGFDGTSNVKAAVMLNIDMRGTHAHAFVSAFVGVDELITRDLTDVNGKTRDFVAVCLEKQKVLATSASPNEGELAAYIAYAQSYPKGFLALIDTYDTLSSGLVNFMSVALALHEFGYKPIGVRLDSGDLAYLSKQCRKMFVQVAEQYNIPYFKNLNIVASNDLSEQVIYALNEQRHEIDTFGIGTHLVTCKAQPALGCVYKLVEAGGHARIKLSQEVSKVTIPGRKDAYRLFNHEGVPILDLLVENSDEPPVAGRRILCHHPFDAQKRAYVTPGRVEKLHELVWDGKLVKPFPTLKELKQRVQDQLAVIREDHLRYLNPTPYKVSITPHLYNFMHELWLKETPITELS